MIFGSPSLDLKLTIFLIVVVFIISLVVLIFARRKIFSLLLFSILANTVFLLGVLTKSDMFDFYNIVWLLYFSFFIWPIINILFLVYYAKTKPKK
ncbi:MAG: hypothetical protein A2359_01170 [Candidatus Moranbacteria bacterium RIFOXYB1_FULL_43_19]|nr:MAG: hypothetical protein A2359_01170 [Candidatus Moranbacteria bacterium RIFOXYB1_FULL_43_19]OGI33023.1 MAG: hypothetical protein A2420_01595 [Candidatus Moranbacteria bacterium RIFOXYC1_FULL_44_13]OGI38435.1 MAG: hypothetical protein A2612_01650 [Candidatus Moranbacteria bacterium RIFOXYD1_FULL_44_12]